MNEMQQPGNVEIITVNKAPNGAFMKALEIPWLEYIGFDPEELKKAESIQIVIKYDESDRKHFKFIGIGKANHAQR